MDTTTILKMTFTYNYFTFNTIIKTFITLDVCSLYFYTVIYMMETYMAVNVFSLYVYTIISMVEMHI